MGGTDAYPSTSFMGMNPYSHAYYTYPTAPSSHQTQSALSSAAAMDFMQSHQNSMLNQWKYSAGTEKLSKSISHGIKSSSTSSLSNRQSNPPHKIGPGTNSKSDLSNFFNFYNFLDVRVRTLDKYRTVYTDRQRLELEKEFRSHQFVTTERKAVLAGELQLTERQVKIWFQNRLVTLTLIFSHLTSFGPRLFDRDLRLLPSKCRHAIDCVLLAINLSERKLLRCF
jgi:hypothetical protein